jgi:hypothetical protein
MTRVPPTVGKTGAIDSKGTNVWVTAGVPHNFWKTNTERDENHRRAAFHQRARLSYSREYGNA